MDARQRAAQQAALMRLRSKRIMAAVHAGLESPGAAEEYERWKAERSTACKQPAPDLGSTPMTA